MIRRLPYNSKDKAACAKAEDYIQGYLQDLLQKHTALTLENTRMSIDRAHTYVVPIS